MKWNRALIGDDKFSRLFDDQIGVTIPAAVLAPVGTILVEEQELTVGDGQPGENTMRLRQALVDIAGGHADDPHGWRTPIAG